MKCGELEKEERSQNPASSLLEQQEEQRQRGESFKFKVKAACRIAWLSGLSALFTFYIPQQCGTRLSMFLTYKRCNSRLWTADVIK
jgi:hypothetical protein